MTRLSIVVLMQGDPQRMEASLVPILQHRPHNAEVVVVLNGPYDDPYELCDEVTFVRAPRRAGWTGSANFGLKHCIGEVVHLVGSGAEVTEGWTDEVLPLFDNPAIAAVSPLLCDADNPRTQRCAAVTLSLAGGRREVPGDADLKTLKKLSAADAPLGPAWQAGFYRRSVLEALGGFDVSSGDALADVEMAARLHTVGYRHVSQHESVVHVGEDETRRRGLLWAMRSERLFWRTVPVRGWLTSLLVHPLAVTGEALLNLRQPLTSALQLLGRVMGLVYLLSCRRHHRALVQLRENLDQAPPRKTRQQETAADGSRRADGQHAATKTTRQASTTPTAA